MIYPKLTINVKRVNMRKRKEFRNMGGKETKINADMKNMFRKVYLIGKGGFSQVWKVEIKNEKGKYYAMKQISKAIVIKNKTISSLICELKMLEKLRNNPFIVKMQYAFQDISYLYIVMDYYKGGDLRYHLNNNVHFNEEQTSTLTILFFL